jgi:hypothetical protein
MSDVLLGVIIGSLIALVGQIIAQIFQLKGTKWRKYQERLDLIFKERIEVYKIMNAKLYALEKAVSKNQNIHQAQEDVTANWTENSVYLPPKVSEKILNVINYTSIMQTDPDSKDKKSYMESLKQAKIALQNLDDINWLPPFE